MTGKTLIPSHMEATVLLVPKVYRAVRYSARSACQRTAPIQAQRTVSPCRQTE